MRFSIITPSFNQLDWLRLCVASVKDQVKTPDSGFRIQDEGGSPARPPFAQNPKSKINNPKSTISPPLAVEHIIQDAGTPGIEEFAREIGADFYRDGQFISPASFRISNYSLTIYCERDAGMYDAINRGLLRATGEICAYLNCDEQYLPGTLGRARGFFEASGETDVLLGAAIVVHPDGSYLCDRRVSIPGRLHTLVSGNLSIFTSSTFFRKSSIVDRRLLFDPEWRVAGDGVWVLSLISANIRMAAISEPLASFVFSGENLSFQKSASSETARLLQMAPVYARIGKPAILAAYRLKRLLSGNYSLPPHTYEIFTQESPDKRTAFFVEHPTFRWRTGCP